MSDTPLPRSGHRQEFVVVVAAFVVGLGVVAVGVASLGGNPAAVRWAVPTAVVAGYELWFLRNHLDRNHPDGSDGERYESLGAANRVTLLRGGAYAAVSGFVLIDPVGWIAWLPALLYGGGAALDWVDGVLARWNDRTTVLGEKLDIGFDTLGFLVAPLVAVLWGRLPVWYLSLSAARYLFVAGTAVRRHRGLEVYDLPESRLRRRLAGLQMAFIAVALAPILPARTVFRVAPFVLLPSLVVFFRDYLVVAGHVGGQNNHY